MSNTLGSAPFSKAVVRAMRKLYPESLADKSWDNTGLLLEAPFDPLRRQMNSVLLTVDLTRAVADEAIERKDSVVIAYHPIIFRGLKALTLADTQQRSLLRLAAEGISVYSPHTALDSAPGGINDWLADIVTGQPATVPDHIEAESNAGETGGEEDGFPFEAHPDPFKGKRPTYLLAHHPSTASLHENADLKLNAVEHSREPIKAFDSETHPGAGQGRVVRFKEKQSLSSLIDRIGRGVGNPKGFPIAIPQDKRLEDISIQSVGICAGSGGSLLTPLQDVDLLFTGELSHHEALGAIERGQVVVALFHSNTERGFLHSVLKLQLQEEVAKEWEALRKEEGQQANGQDEDLAEAWDDGYVNIEVSERDRDPYGILIAKTDL
ncbi:NGG1p interacting factor 3 [Microthyrium microscopicum]|uniref:NGG1p interacting factor 3 n=1 Tax=Microthyrium microscopicum TaxID=703497 RepID=A0A6A6UHG5_9PEZI|nr:NGG1p interacting factor 3 [Microthyrium microscopicum]